MVVGRMPKGTTMDKLLPREIAAALTGQLWEDEFAEQVEFEDPSAGHFPES
jgi:hypothetical protein